MRYAREHIKRYWAFSYSRALGVSTLTFAIALAIGMTFTSLLSQFFNINYVAEFLFWLLLIIITAIVLVASTISVHMSMVKYMNEYEYRKHSKYTGIWMAVLAIGAVAFFAPLLFFNNYLEPFIFLFSFGGVFWVFYLSAAVIFKHRYHEMAFGAVALWIIFAVGIIGLYSSGIPYYASPQQIAAVARFGLFLSMISLVIILGITGVALIFNSSKAFVGDVSYLMGIMENAAPGGRKRPRRRR